MSDLISRQAIVYHTQLEAMGNGVYEEVDVAYRSEIESIPSERESGWYIPLDEHTVERVNRLHKNECGDYFDEEWLYQELEQLAVHLSSERESGEWDNNFKCSNCGRILEDIHVIDARNGEAYNFCPVCGADMRPKDGEKE